MVTYCKPVLSRLNINVCFQSYSKCIMIWWLEKWRLKVIQYCKYLISTGSLRRCWFCPVWNKIRRQIVIFLDITSGYVRKWCGCSFLSLCMIAQCEALKICAVESDLFFFHYSCWEHPRFWWVQGSVTNNTEWCKYILHPFRIRFVDHIFPSWNFWVSLGSDKVKTKVWSIPLEPGFSPRGEVGISRGMGVIPSLPGLLLLAQTFLPSSLGAMQGSVCTIMCTAPVLSKFKSICSC